MPSYEIASKPVAFTVTISGLIDMDYEVGVDSPVERIMGLEESMGNAAAVYWLMRFADKLEVSWEGDSRNYPVSLGGFLMPEDVSVGVCEACGASADHPRGECA